MDELKHYGILGMRWGIRRERGSDGRVTSKVEPTSPKKRSISELSNEQLRAMNERMNLEKQYRELSKQEVSTGKSVVKKVLATSGQAAATTIATAAMIYLGKQIITKAAGPDVTAAMFPKKK